MRIHGLCCGNFIRDIKSNIILRRSFHSSSACQKKVPTSIQTKVEASLKLLHDKHGKRKQTTRTKKPFKAYKNSKLPILKKLADTGSKKAYPPYEFHRSKAYKLINFDKFYENKAYRFRIGADDSRGEYIPLKSVNTTENVPTLKHKLSRVLFSPGVHYLQDPRTQVYNFNPYLKQIMPIQEFDFNAITKYVTSSKDVVLSTLAKQHKKKFYSSTSSMTGVLTHLHFLFSNFRPQNFLDFSRHQKSSYGLFTKGSKLPASLIVRKKGDVYAIDSDKSTDKEMILSLLGHSLERYLTKSPEEFETYRKDKISGKSEIEREIEESSYHYAKMNDFIMRSQLDCVDSRLPGNGTFDLKTRAVSAVRFDIAKVERDSTGYQILKTFGEYESFEREQLELAKSTLIKYSLQARIGNMDGIFIAYHNTSEMFGFEYMPLSKIDEILHSFGLPEFPLKDHANGEPYLKSKEAISTVIANDEFKLSIRLWSHILNKIISTEIKESSFRFIVKAKSLNKFETKLTVIAVPITEEQVEKIQGSSEELNTSLLDTPDDGINEVIETHTSRIQEMNEKLCVNPIGYDIFVKNFINGVESLDRHPTYTSVEDEWESLVKVVELDRSLAVDYYNSFLKEKLKMLEFSASVKGDDEVDNFVQILRRYGKRGDLLRTSNGTNEIIWNDE